MNVELIEEYSTPEPDKAAAFAARTCYMSDSPVETCFNDAIAGVDVENDVYSTEDQHRKLLKQLISRGHFSPFEHTKAYFAIEGISRNCMAQATRHRHLGFSVQSMRYCDFSDTEPVIPPSFDETEAHKYEIVSYSVFRAYDDAVDSGIPKEDARFYLPLGTPVNMIMSGNMRSLMHFIDMRHAADSQWEVRDLAEQVLEELREWSPLTTELYEQHAKGSSKKAP